MNSESISRLRSSAFVHSAFSPNSSFFLNIEEERRHDMDSCEAVLSGQGKNYGQYWLTARHESITERQ